MRYTQYVSYSAQPVVSHSNPNTQLVDCAACANIAQAERLASAYQQRGSDTDIFWSVYGFNSGGTVTLIGDFDGEQYAKEIVARITGCDVPNEPDGEAFTFSYGD